MAERPHGRARYVHGPGPGSDRSQGCRCDVCTEANRAYARELDRNRRRPDPTPPHLVDATEAREHLLMLQAAGLGRRTIATLAKIEPKTVRDIRDGRHVRCRRRVADAILLVFPIDAAPGAYVPAGPTWALLDRLLALGYTRTDLARRLGSTAKVPSLQVGRSQVTGETAAQVRALYRELMPEDEHRRIMDQADRRAEAAERRARYRAAEKARAAGTG